MREKLIELLGGDMCKDCYCEDCEYEHDEKSCIEHIKRKMADHLIANGVTIHKWIPVTEQEEPTENGTYLCHGYWFGSRRKQTETADFFGEWNIANNFILTHWMPLPEPPKGE